MFASLIAIASMLLGSPPRAVGPSDRAPLNARQIQRDSSPPRADSLLARRQAAEAVQRFLITWRKAWLASERARLRVELSPRNPNYANAQRIQFGRTINAQCPVDGFVEDKYAGPIKSANSGFGKCPTPLLTDSRQPIDELDVRDAAISLPGRANVQSDRAMLIATLDSLQRLAPIDVFIVGQLVRFMVDEGRFDDAIRTASRCVANQVWCAALGGYALAARGRLAAADSAFELVTRLSPPSARCEWTDIGAILLRPDRKKYLAQSCAARDSLAGQYWWLARPLLLDIPGAHVRRVEHYRRKVQVLLHASLPFDELHDMRPTHGGDAVVELLLRYGWPTVAAWTSDSVDKRWDKFLFDAHVPVASPYSTAEYSPGRVQFGAAWSAVLNPFGADTLGWQLRPPPNKTDIAMILIRDPQRPWVPLEHMRFSGAAVTELPAGQTAFFRRPRSLRVVTALETDAALRDASDETPRATLVASTSPDSIVIVAESPVSRSGRVEFIGDISARPILIGVESRGTASHPLTARTRFGAEPPPPLDSLRSGEIAISAPVFFEATNSSDHLRNLEALSHAMLGSTAVQQGSKVGLFWETYGAVASDSVRYTVQIKRMEAIGLMQRIGALLRVVDLPMTSVAISWQDARRAETPQTVSNAAPLSVSIATGSIVLDVAALSRGTYMIEVAATAQGRVEARAGRVLTIR